MPETDIVKVIAQMQVGEKKDHLPHPDLILTETAHRILALESQVRGILEDLHGLR